MERLKLDFGENSYDIVFETSFDALCDALAKINAPKKLLIVTDSNVEAIYAREVLGCLQGAGYDMQVYAFPAGEQQKHMQTILSICGACMKHQMDRKSMILALGGGVVGDMAGFAAAIYMRGIRFVQIPTTLLSQSDSSVGGKTGIDFAGSKNSLGAFHQPKLVYLNVSTLKTLPKREFISGMGEVVKHGIIYDRDFFVYLKENAEKIKSLDEKSLIHMANTNCSIKAKVVVEDEKETGLRAILNFGHTIGHAAESAMNFAMTHGECVSLGMCAASYIAAGRGLIKEEEFLQIKEVLSLYDLPVSAVLPDTEKILDFMQKDKKKLDGALKFILPTQIGSVISVTDVTEEEICRAIESIRR